jgi:Fibrobacter succinogenes major domain (Fib_succ_major).
VKNVSVKDLSVNFMLGAAFLAVLVWACTDAESDAPAEPAVESLVQEGTPFTDPRDNRVYKTVKVGEQVWMAENMKFYDADKKGGFYGKSWCYGGLEENCETYGRLYHWEPAVKACPEGWHLPSKDEFTTLFEDVGGVDVAGRMLKAKEFWPESDKNDDSYGMRIVPGGYYYMKNFFLRRRERLPVDFYRSARQQHEQCGLRRRPGFGLH